jgi:hypothetical protein
VNGWCFTTSGSKKSAKQASLRCCNCFREEKKKKIPMRNGTLGRTHCRNVAVVIQQHQTRNFLKQQISRRHQASVAEHMVQKTAIAAGAAGM